MHGKAAAAVSSADCSVLLGGPPSCVAKKSAGWQAGAHHPSHCAAAAAAAVAVACLMLPAVHAALEGTGDAVAAAAGAAAAPAQSPGPGSYPGGTLARHAACALVVLAPAVTVQSSKAHCYSCCRCFCCCCWCTDRGGVTWFWVCCCW